MGTQPTRSYLEERISTLELNYARSQNNMNLELAVLRRQLDNLPDDNRWESIRLATVETVLMWRHTYGPNSRRANTYTFTAIKRAPSIWQLSSGIRISFDELCSDYLNDAEDGEVFKASRFERI